LDTGVEVLDAVPPDQRTPQTSQPVVVHGGLERHHTRDGLAALGDDQLASPAGHLVDQAEAMRLQFRNRYRPYHLTILDLTWSSVNSHLSMVASRGARRGRIDPEMGDTFGGGHDLSFSLARAWEARKARSRELSNCGSESAISYHGALRSTKMCLSGRSSGSPSSRPAGTSNHSAAGSGVGRGDPPRRQNDARYRRAAFPERA